MPTPPKKSPAPLPPAVPTRTGFDNLVRGLGAGFSTAGLDLADTALAVPDLFMDSDRLTAARAALAAEKEADRKFYDPQGGAGVAGDLLGQGIPQVATSLLGAGATAKAAGALAKMEGLGVVARGAGAVAEGLGASKLLPRAAASTAINAPADFLHGVQSAKPGESALASGAKSVAGGALASVVGESVASASKALGPLAVKAAKMGGDWAEKLGLNAETTAAVQRILDQSGKAAAGDVPKGKVGQALEAVRTRLANNPTTDGALKVAGQTAKRAVVGAGIGGALGNLAGPEDGQEGRTTAGAVTGAIAGALANRPAMERMNVALADRFLPLRQLEETFAPGSKAVSQAVDNRGAAGIADVFLGNTANGITAQPAGPGTLKYALEAARGIEEPTKALAMARRALELHANGYGEKLNQSLPELQQTVATLERVPEVKHAADALEGVYRNLQEARAAEGLIDAPTKAATDQTGQHYIPFVRDIEEDAAKTGGHVEVGPGGELRVMEKGNVKKLDVVDPYQQAALDVQRTSDRIVRQRALNAVANLVRGSGGQTAGVIERVGAESADDAARGFGKTFESGSVPLQARARKLMNERPDLAPDEAMQEVERARPGGGVQADGDRTFKAVNPESGQWETFVVRDPKIAGALEHLDPSTRDPLHWTLRLPAKMLRWGTTNSPTFVASNAARDAAYSQLTRKIGPEVALGAGTGAAYGALTGKDGERTHDALRDAALGGAALPLAVQGVRSADAMKDILRNTDGVQAWKMAGGTGGGLFDAVRDPESAANLVAHLRSQGAGTALDKDIMQKALTDVPGAMQDAVAYVKRQGQAVLDPGNLNPLEQLKRINELVEQAPRYAKFKDGYLAGKGAGAAAVDARQQTVDFDRMGDTPILEHIKQATPFWNPQIQGLMQTGRTLNPATREGVNAWGRGAATMTAPTMALWEMNKDDPTYQAAPAWKKALFWHVPIGQNPDGKTKFLLVPKPFEAAHLFSTLPEITANETYKAGKRGGFDGEAMREALQNIVGSTLGGLVPLPTAVAVPAQIAANYDAFRGGPIESAAMQKLPVDKRGEATASYPAVKVGEALDVSPAKVDFAIRGVGGQAGYQLSKLATKGAEAAGLDTRPPGPTDDRDAAFNRFTKVTDGFQSDDVQHVYTAAAENQQHINYIQSLIDAGRIPEGRAYAQQHAQVFQEGPLLEMGASVLSSLAQFKNAVATSQSLGGATLTPDQKKAVIDQLGQRAQLVAKLVRDKNFAQLKALQAAMQAAEGAAEAKPQ